MNSINDLLSRIETARMWGYFHKDWLLQIRESLRAQLSADYRVFVESEAVLISPDSTDPIMKVMPDVAVTTPAGLPEAIRSEFPDDGTVATIDVDEPIDVDTQYSLVIRRAPENYVVAAVELLSPSNKGVGNRLDEEAHLRKRDAYLHAGVSLIEIDALLKGRRVLPDPIASLASYERLAWTMQYDVGRRRYRGWGWNQSDPLPVLNWQIDLRAMVRIDLARTAEQAVAFNDWDHFPAQA